MWKEFGKMALKSKGFDESHLGLFRRHSGKALVTNVAVTDCKQQWPLLVHHPTEQSDSTLAISRCCDILHEFRCHIVRSHGRLDRSIQLHRHNSLNSWNRQSCDWWNWPFLGFLDTIFHAIWWFHALYRLSFCCLFAILSRAPRFALIWVTKTKCFRKHVKMGENKPKKWRTFHCNHPKRLGHL